MRHEALRYISDIAGEERGGRPPLIRVTQDGIEDQFSIDLPPGS
jgi:hypothetical protein